MTFDDNSTRQHFKGVLVSLVTPNEADWYVYCLRHYNLKSKLLIGFLQQATYGFVVQSEEMLFSNRESSEFRRFLFRYMLRTFVSQRYRNVFARRLSRSIKQCKDKNYFSFRNGLLAFFNQKLSF